MRTNKSKKTKRNKPKKSQILTVRNGQWAPTRVRTTLRYALFTTILNASAAVANIRLTPTNAYDVNPVLGSTAMPGFTEFGGIYRLYRVQASRIKVSFANEQAFNVVVYIIPVNTDPGANYVGTTATQFLSNTFCRQSILGPLTGENNKTVTNKTSTQRYGGVWDRDIIDTYVGSTNGGTVPANNWYWAIGIVGTATVSAGVDVMITMDVDIEFFELLNPSA